MRAGAQNVRQPDCIGYPVIRKGFGGDSMKLGKTTSRACPSNELHTCLSIFPFVLLAFCAAIQQTAGAQQQGLVSGGNSWLTTTQVVEKLIEMNLRRAQALRSYHGTRIYKVEYRGLLG